MDYSTKLFFKTHLTPGAEGVHFRGFTGADEMAIENASTHNLIGLLESLIISDTSGNKIQANQIVTAERDRILAFLFISMYGEKIESTVNCISCGEKFDLDFSLNELLRHYPPAAEASDNGKYQLEPGIIFRLPTGEDEMKTVGLSGVEAERQLLERCLIEGSPETDSERVQSKMAEIAPVLNMEMQAECPECGLSQSVQFDIQSFFLTKIRQERHLLFREVHNIASQYHWSHQEILNLPRNLRKQYAALIHPDN